MSKEFASESHLKAYNLSGSRSGQIIFNNISFTITEGQCLKITGPNGSGKSTLLSILAGLIRPHSGSVSRSPFETQAIRYSGHKSGLKNALTIKENINFWRKIYGCNSDSVEEVTKNLSLQNVLNTYTGLLSEGVKKRASLAIVTIGHAPIWILDEPYASLDKENINLLDGLINIHLNKGGIVAFSSHQESQLPITTSIDMNLFTT